MSWIRSAVNRAVEVGANNNLRRIRGVADSVVHHAGQAVVGGAKLFHDRIVNSYNLPTPFPNMCLDCFKICQPVCFWMYSIGQIWCHEA